MKNKGKRKQADGGAAPRQDPQPSGRKEAAPATQAALVAAPQQPFKNKEKVLILSSRGVTFRWASACMPNPVWGFITAKLVTNTFATPAAAGTAI